MDKRQKTKIYKDINNAVKILQDARARLIDELDEDGGNDITDDLHYIIRDIYDELESIANLPAE